MEKMCDDISREILIRLPAINIAQLRRVCKRWNALLCEASFIKFHLHRSINNNDKDEILLVFNPIIPFKAYSSTSPDIELVNFIKLPVNFPSEKAQLKEITVIGYVNGLVCFSVGGYYDDRVIYVWNPSLSALLIVPPYTISVPSRSGLVECLFRFGFDRTNDDYKIVKLIAVRRIKQPAEWLQVEVYSMKSGCWKLITQSPPSRASKFYNHWHILVCPDGHDGYLHWLCYYDNSKVKTIVAFDLAVESFSEISLLDPLNFDFKSYRHRLGVFGGKLCVISRSTDAYYCKVLWVMDQYGSWVKNGFSHFHKRGIYQLGFTLKNNFIYQDYNRVIHLYDPDAPSNKVKHFQKDMPKRYLGDFVIIPYVESLVWVTPPTC